VFAAKQAIKSVVFYFNQLSFGMRDDIKAILAEAAYRFEQSAFLAHDPILIPHQFSLRQDIEIAAFWTAILAWGQRKTIINNAQALMARMDNAPYAFILHHQETDRKAFLNFKHRTFQATDTLYFLEFLQQYYRQHHSLEEAFTQYLSPEALHTGPALAGFHELFFALPDAPERTRKHIPTPERNSACKRLNMFLRWMVRSHAGGVDFGLWTNIRPAQLLIPLDVHVERVARALGLLERKQSDWKAVLELTENLRQLDPLDPVKYDFALFGLGVLEKHPSSW
jgi:uncharacterized protein (TIGR02757 family)